MKNAHAGGSGHVYEVTIRGGECEVEHVRRAITKAILEARKLDKTRKGPCGCGS